jgi:polysaccharide biosynthesis transport protein
MRNFKKLNPMDHLVLVWKRRWYFVITALLVSAAGAVYAYKAPLKYRSTARILMEQDFISQEYVHAAVTNNQSRLIPVLNLVQSRSFLEQLIENFQLEGYGQDSMFVMDNAVREVGSAIVVRSATENTFTMSYVGKNPQIAYAVTKGMTELLLQTTTLTRQQKAIDADEFLDEQMRQAERNLQVHEEKIKQFKNAHLGGLPEQSNTNLTSLSQLQSQLTVVENSIQNAREQRKMLEIRLEEQHQLRTLSRSNSRMETLLRPAGRETNLSSLQQQLRDKQAQLAAVTAKYTPKHPDVVRLTREVAELEQAVAKASEGSEAPSSAIQENSPDHQERSDPMFLLSDAQIQAQIESRDSDIARYEREREEINQQIKMYQSRLNLVPTVEQEMVSLEREHEFLKQQYASLQNKKFNTQMSANLETNKKNAIYKVIDEANLPGGPERPGRAMIALMGLAAGFCFGLGAVYGREYFDDTLSTGDDAQELLKIPVLVQIPEVPPRALIKHSLAGRHK